MFISSLHSSLMFIERSQKAILWSLIFYSVSIAVDMAKSQMDASQIVHTKTIFKASYKYAFVMIVFDPITWELVRLQWSCIPDRCDAHAVDDRCRSTSID